MGFYRMYFELPGLPPMVNKSNALSWKANMGHRRKWRRMSMLAARAAGIPPAPLNKATVTLTRYSSREPDFDGLVSGMKSLLDGLKDALVIVDDKMSNIGVPTYIWEKCKPGTGKVSVEVREIYAKE